MSEQHYGDLPPNRFVTCPHCHKHWATAADRAAIITCLWCGKTIAVKEKP